MPNALRAYNSLKQAGVTDDKALAVAALVATSKTPGAVYDESQATDVLFEAGFEESLAEAVARVIANCFPTQKFSRTYNRTALRTALVRGQWTSVVADALLDAIEPCVVTPSTKEVRSPVRHYPGPGKVVMCDFSFLKKPEMQKERRAIVVSTRAASGPDRCAVIPVSKKRAATPSPYHYEFSAGSYAFFHAKEPVWAVCDHVYTVGLNRLWQINVRDRPQLPSISSMDLEAVRTLLGTAMGVIELT